MADTAEQVPDFKHLWYAVMIWAAKSGVTRIDTLPECYERDFVFEGLPTHVSINGHADRKAKSQDGMELDPFYILIMVNGWPGILCGRTDGVIVTADPTTEDRLIAAFEAA